jgi:hypothetical protein
MIYLTKGGFRKNEWNGEIRQYEDVPIKSILAELRGACRIEEDVTLGDIFAAVEQSEPLCLILGEWAWCDCSAFHREVKRPGSASSLKWIEIARTAEIEKDGEIQFGLDVRGRDETDTMWAIDFTPVNELRDLPVKLASEFTLWDWRGEEPAKQALKVDCYSLLDVLGELYYEVSFHGSPADRNERGCELAEMAKAVKDGTAKLTPWNPSKDLIQ